MNLRIEVPPNLEIALKLRASAAGKDIAGFVVDALREELSQGELTSDTPNPSASSFSEWLAAWRQGAPKTNHFVDDSRESIYGGRGE
jgi:hypothetical protein